MITPAEAGIEQIIVAGVLWLKLAIEAVGALTIALGAVLATRQFLEARLAPDREAFNGVRLILARYLALGLEFQLGADILATAIAPSWDAIGKLAAIAVIRTALNFFLSREMQADVSSAARPPQRTN